MNRLKNLFEALRRKERAALIVFVEAGFPNLEQSEKDVELAVANGADVIEIGVPFSDPMADGPVIADASRIALSNHAHLPEILEMTERIRMRHPETGLILFSYMNVLFSYGLENLCRKLSEIGADGILPVDLPLEEREELFQICKKNSLCLIPLVSPTTPLERAERIAQDADGFLYCVSVRGITGARDAIPAEIQEQLDHVKKISKIPVVVGFGISNGATAQAMARHADGVVVGSAFIKADDKIKLMSDLRRNLDKNQRASS